MPTTNTNTNANGKTDWKKNEIGALWKRKAAKSGESYFTGTLTFQEAVKPGQKIQVILFSNKNKKSDNQPDVTVYISEKPAGQAPAEQAKPAAKAQAPTQTEETDSSVF